MNRFISIIVFVTAISMPLPALADEAVWSSLMDGIEKHTMDQNLRDEFTKLCQENDTALINGRIDTGGGLYMEMDVPVFANPGINKTTTLENGAMVVLIGESAEADSIEWVRIKFLFISAYTEKAVSIDDGWVEKSQLR
ncbi:MAG: hypothetical protein HQ572_05215 [Candidatus Omnitrophica bacterium]|nr:hypothetical protein [Candidatus Omnitrophota bacterium]